MGFSAEQGYIAATIAQIIDDIMEGVNNQFGTTYTTETFLGTNWYKYSYALAQKIQTNEVKASEVFLKLQDYFATTNEVILDPKVTPNGIIEALAAADYVASVKPMIDADAGKASICVDVDSADPAYAATKLEICGLIKDYVSLGVVTQGTESETLTLSNGQAFDFKYKLPTRIATLLRLTITTSRNNTSVIANPETTKLKLIQNIEAEYKLGRDFEPERYFDVTDAPWASDIVLEYSIDGGANYLTTVYEATFDHLLTILLADTELIEE